MLENLITLKTLTIIPVHAYVDVCNVDEVERMAKKYTLKVIYDAAHAFGVNVDGKGGALIFNDPSLENILNAYKKFGITGQEIIDYVGDNAKMNEFQVAMGLCNLRHVDQEIQGTN